MLLTYSLGILRNHDGDAADNVDKKKKQKKNELCFTYESRDTLKSLILSITVKTIAKINPEHSGQI